MDSYIHIFIHNMKSISSLHECAFSSITSKVESIFFQYWDCVLRQVRSHRSCVRRHKVHRSMIYRTPIDHDLLRAMSVWFVWFDRQAHVACVTSWYLALFPTWLARASGRGRVGVGVIHRLRSHRSGMTVRVHRLILSTKRHQSVGLHGPDLPFLASHKPYVICTRSHRIIPNTFVVHLSFCLLVQ